MELIYIYIIHFIFRMEISLKYMFHLSIYQYGKSWLIIMLTGEYTMAHMILNFHIIFQ